MLKASPALKIPIFVTTQNRARLGETASELQKLLTAESTRPLVRVDIDKTLFSMVTPEVQVKLPVVRPTTAAAAAAAAADADGRGGVENTGPLDVLIVGMETHICVTQTTLDLLALGHRVYVLADGVSSCNAEESVVALKRLRDAGAIVTTSESVLFEILGDAKHAGFKAVSAMVKESKDETKAALGAFCKI
jgi:hypothetical protein